MFITYAKNKNIFKNYLYYKLISEVNMSKILDQIHAEINRITKKYPYDNKLNKHFTSLYHTSEDEETKLNCIKSLYNNNITMVLAILKKYYIFLKGEEMSIFTILYSAIDHCMPSYKVETNALYTWIMFSVSRQIQDIRVHHEAVSLPRSAREAGHSVASVGSDIMSDWSDCSNGSRGFSEVISSVLDLEVILNIFHKQYNDEKNQEYFKLWKLVTDGASIASVAKEFKMSRQLCHQHIQNIQSKFEGIVNTLKIKESLE